MKRTLDLKLKLHCPHNPLLAVFEVYHAMCLSIFHVIFLSKRLGNLSSRTVIKAVQAKKNLFF